MKNLTWLAINYNLPSEPSRIRVAAWRNLKKLGAVSLQQSMWILPYNGDNRKALEEMVKDMEREGGEAFIMQTSFINEKDENKVISYFNSARDEEYKEVLEKCDDFFKEIEKEVGRRNFTFAEIEENEEELEKLLSWHGKIKARDIFGSALGKPAGEKLAECRELLEDFSSRVYKYINQGREMELDE